MSRQLNNKRQYAPAASKRRATSSGHSDLQQMVAEKVAVIEKATFAELKQIWTDEFGIVPPPIRAYEIFRRMVAWRFQEQYLGGLSQSARAQLARLMAALDRDPKGERALFRLKPGFTLVREWKGVKYHVQLLDEGFEYQGKVYASLSEIARLITGTRWSGPLFFGLKKTQNGRKVKA